MNIDPYEALKSLEEGSIFDEEGLFDDDLFDDFVDTYFNDEEDDEDDSEY